MAIGLSAAVLAAMFVFGGEGYIFSVGQVPQPIAAKPPAPTQIEVAPPPAKLANDVEPPTPSKHMCSLRSPDASTCDFSDRQTERYCRRFIPNVLFYPDDTPDCLHRPPVDPSWHAALVRHLLQYKGRSDTQPQGMVLLVFTVDRSGHVLNREIVTVKIGPVANREIVHNSGHQDNEAIWMIDRAQPLPPFPDSMTEAKLDLIAPIYVPVKLTPPQPRPSKCQALYGWTNMCPTAPGYRSVPSTE
jgi:protein TonB